MGKRETKLETKLVTALVLAIAASAAACGANKDLPAPTMDSGFTGPPPVPAAQLDAVYALNSGLLTGVGSDGLPALSGPTADPLITETRRFYDTVQAPFASPVTVDYPDPFTGSTTLTARKTAPLTLDVWKATFGFSPQNPGESLHDYRERVDIAVYYNRNELALGRQLGCARFLDGHDDTGAPLTGIACFVSNHGMGFRQGQAALDAAVQGTAMRNTVSITYRPSMDPGYQVQFYTYGADGKRQDWARLDTHGPRPHPQICMTCHGGVYDDQRHLAKNAHFLPLDPNVVVFPDAATVPAELTRRGQEERIREFNAMALETPLTPAQRELIDNLYSGAATTVGAVATGDSVPAAWKGSDTDQDFYRAVLQPHCATCHMAAQRGLDNSELWPYTIFSSPATFDAAPIQYYVCGKFSMPNAQPTALAFWDAENNPGAHVGGASFTTAADALLARRGLNRSSCLGLADISGCDRGDDPDALCGGAVSGGALCDRATNRCVPMTIPPH